jgi:DNA-binding SARP family transcriptional activator
LPFELQSAVLEAKLALRLSRDTAAARGTLERLERETPLDEYCYVRELADTWYGLALLRDGSDAEAFTRLRRAVDSMREADRILELPQAAVFLAEAAWRSSDEETADQAADLALEAAARQGSNHILLQALGEFPSVASRRIDAEPSADSPWHEIGRALRAQGLAPASAWGTWVELQEFGQIAVWVDGQEVRPRLSKSLELLAFLAHSGGAAARDELLDALFDGRADRSTRTYLRQAAHTLREVLPGTTSVSSDGREVRLSEGIRIATQSQRFEQQLAAAARFQGTERIAATLKALAIPAEGDYLPGLSSAWVDARREHLAALSVNAYFEAAELAFAGGRYREADQLVARVLAADAFREGAWRLAMRIAGALGDDDEVMRAYRRCERALATIGTSPAASTRQLLERLRR